MLGNSSAPIIIAGMHRSGTSLVADLLEEMGMYIGSHKSSQQEAYTFRDANHAMLRAAGGHWAKPEPFLARLGDPGFVDEARRTALAVLESEGDRFGAAPEGRPWGWKDPRTTVTLAVWRTIYPEARVIHVERSGLDVALSLRRRELVVLRRRFTKLKFGGPRGLMLPPTLARGYHLWELYTRAALADEPHWRNWMTIRFEDLLARPVESLRDVHDFVGLRLKPDDLRRLAEARLRKPHSPSKSDLAQFRLLARLGLVRLDLMKQLGYEI